MMSFCFVTLLKVGVETIKNSNYHLSLVVHSKYHLSTKNYQITLYCRFINITKGPGTRYQSIKQGLKPVTNVGLKLSLIPDQLSF